MSGTYVWHDATTITLHHGGGAGDTTHNVAADPTVTINGHPAKVTDLKPGDEVELSGDPVVSVKAKR